MAVIRNLVVKIGADIGGLTKGLANAQKQLHRVSKQIEKVGKGLTAKITTPLVGFATVAVTASSKIEQAMLTIAKGFNGTSEEVDNLTNLAKKMSSTTTQSIDKVASSMNYLKRAGYSVAEMETSLVTLSNLATGAGVDYETATAGVVKVLGQFNLTASDTNKVANVMSAAIANSNMTFDELTTNLNLVGQVASSFGYSIEDVSATLVELSNAGYNSSEAGTYLKGILLKLSSPTSEMTKQLSQLGLTAEDINPATHSLVEILETFEKANITSADATALFGNQLDDVFMTLVSQGSSSLKELTAEITNTNSAEDEATKKMNTLQGQLTQIKSMLADIAVQFGDILIPKVKAFLENCIIPLIEKFQGLSEESKELIIKIGAIAAAIGPVILLIGKVIEGVGGISGVLSKLGGKWTLILAAIAALVAGLVDLYKNNEEFRDKVQELWSKLKDFVQGVCERLKAFWDKYGEQIMNSVREVFLAIFTIVSEVVGKVVEVISKLWQALVDFWNNNEKFRESVIKVWNSIKETITKTISFIVEWWNEYGERLFNSIATILAKVLEVVMVVLGEVMEIVSTLFEVIEPIWGDLCEVFMMITDVLMEVWEIIEPIFNAIVEIVKWVFDACGGIIKGAIQALEPFIKAILNVLQIITNVVGAIVDLFRGDFSGAFEHVKNVGEGFKNFFSNLWNGILSVGKWFVDSFVNLFKNLGSSLGNIAQGIGERVGGFFSNLWNGMKSTATSVWDNIKNGFSNFGNWISNAGSNIGNTCSNIWGNVKGWFSNLGDTLKSGASNIATKVKDTFTNFGNSVSNIASQGYNWGSNMVNMIGDGIKSTVSKVKDACSSVIGKIKGWLGFGSPTKEGPGRYSDEWAPNLMDMYTKGITTNIPEIQDAVDQVADVVATLGMGNTEMVSTGDTNLSTDVLNGLLSAMTTMKETDNEDVNQSVELSIDGDVFARLIMPKLKGEFNRTGVILKEGGF